MQKTNTIEAIRHLTELETCIQQMHDAIEALDENINRWELHNGVKLSRENLSTRVAMTRVEVEKLFHNASGLLVEATERVGK